jgi:two-component SAPR family response regulator
MKKNIYLLFFLFLIPCLSLTAQGLKFNSNDSFISKRTSFNLFEYEKPKIEGDLIISFELSIYETPSYGYILNIKDKSNPISYSLALVFEKDQTGTIQNFLKFNIDNEEEIFSIPLDKNEIDERKWNNITISLNESKSQISLSINEKHFKAPQQKVLNMKFPEIVFGKRGRIIDVPAISIRNVKVENGSKKFNFKLNEKDGEVVHDSLGIVYGKVENPNWLINRAYNWNLEYTKKNQAVTSISFDKNKNQFIFQNKDSLSFFDLNSKTVFSKTYEGGFPLEMNVGLSFLDPQKNKLFVYELFGTPIGEPSIVSIDLDGPFIWKRNSSKQMNEQKHHYTYFLDTEKQQFVTFGGYGNYKYSNEFTSYDINKDTFLKLKFKGDNIMPRLFSGSHFKNDKFYIFGGYGNKTGNQILGKVYYNDFYEVDIRNKSIRKLWDTKDDDYVSSRNIILNADNSYFFTLRYKEYIPKTFLNLFKYSTETGSYEILGDSISFISEKIRSNVNLYLNKTSDQLFVTTQEYHEDGSNNIKVYSIDYPPVSREGFYDNVNKEEGSKSYLYLLSLLILIVIALIYLYNLFYKKKISRVELESEAIKIEEGSSSKIYIINSIFLFGNFVVISSKGKDISYLFSPKLRQCFLLILFNSKIEDQVGIESKKLEQIAWPDSPHKKANNLKNVMINQIRRILEELEGIELVYSKGYYRLDCNELFFCDYKEFEKYLYLISNENTNQDYLKVLSNLINRGNFLDSINEYCFDSEKSEFELKVLTVLENILKVSFSSNNYISSITLADIILKVDPLNEKTLQYKIISLNKIGHYKEAKKVFNSFLISYNKIQGENFSKTFGEILNQKK